MLHHQINSLLDDKYSERSIQFIIAEAKFVYGRRNEDRMDWIPYEEYLGFLTDRGKTLNDIKEFKKRYELECKNGVIAKISR